MVNFKVEFEIHVEKSDGLEDRESCGILETLNRLGPHSCMDDFSPFS